MAAYVVILREGVLKDQAEYDAYLQLARQTAPPPANMKFLAAYGAIKPLEGEAPDGVAILEFPSMDEASAWYDGPYGTAAKHRVASGDWRAFILQGL